MKTVLSVLCCLGVLVFLTACDNDDDGTAGGYGSIPQVGYDIQSGNTICYNSDKSSRLDDKQTCTWRCALYENRNASWVQLTFDWVDGDYQLTDERFAACFSR